MFLKIKNNETSGRNWNKFVLLPKIKNDQKDRENNFQKHKYIYFKNWSKRY